MRPCSVVRAARPTPHRHGVLDWPVAGRRQRRPIAIAGCVLAARARFFFFLPFYTCKFFFSVMTGRFLVGYPPSVVGYAAEECQCRAHARAQPARAQRAALSSPGARRRGRWHACRRGRARRRPRAAAHESETVEGDAAVDSAAPGAWPAQKVLERLPPHRRPPRRSPVRRLPEPRLRDAASRRRPDPRLPRVPVVGVRDVRGPAAHALPLRRPALPRTRRPLLAPARGPPAAGRSRRMPVRAAPATLGHRHLRRHPTPPAALRSRAPCSPAPSRRHCICRPRLPPHRPRPSKG